jgi:lipid-binding SYLF domain-containing protein
MKRSYRYLVSVLLVLMAGTAFTRTVEDYSGTIDIYKKSPVVQGYFENAYGYAVYPTIGKAGFIVGGAVGDGQVYVGGKVTGFSTLTQLSVGFQLGGQAFSQIIFFQDKRAYDEFTSGSFEFDATASAVAITAGAQASTGGTGNTAGVSAGPATAKQAETSYKKGMATFIHAKGGLMYEASVGGQKFSFMSLEEARAKAEAEKAKDAGE